MQKPNSAVGSVNLDRLGSIWTFVATRTAGGVMARNDNLVTDQNISFDTP